jgi:tetratricopeptide (TPR) repeat protein
MTMDSRTPVWVSLVLLTLGCAGCITTQNQKDLGNNGSAPPTTVARNEEPPPEKPKTPDGPKRNPKPSTEVKLGEIKETEAESEMNRSRPEIQARLRDEARKAYQHAIKIDPNFVDAYRHLALLYAKTNDFDRALDIYKKVLTKNPKDAAVWYDLGQCHNRRKDFGESVHCFQKAIELEPENRDYLKTLGFTLAWTGQTEQGLKYLTRTQGSALAHYNIARILLQRDRLDEAQFHLRLALRENSHLEQARELLDSLETPATAAAQLEGPVSR